MRPDSQAIERNSAISPTPNAETVSPTVEQLTNMSFLGITGPSTPALPSPALSVVHHWVAGGPRIPCQPPEATLLSSFYESHLGEDTWNSTQSGQERNAELLLLVTMSTEPQSPREGEQLL